MGSRLAVRGPMLAGKTTLARRLEEQAGFVFLNYTDLLKAFAADALSHLGYPTSVTDILAEKERYRGFLQELGTLTGFDVGTPIEGMLAEAFATHGEDASYVWDNVRFLGQWQQLQKHGFILVHLQLAPLAQEERAASLGISPEHLGVALAHPAEMGFPEQEDEIQLDARRPIAELVEQVLWETRVQEAA